VVSILTLEGLIKHERIIQQLNLKCSDMDKHKVIVRYLSVRSSRRQLRCVHAKINEATIRWVELMHLSLYTLSVHKAEGSCYQDII